MTPEQFKKADEIFQAACVLPPEEQIDYLNNACDGDDLLRKQVLRLLRHDQRPIMAFEPLLGATARVFSEELLRNSELPMPVRIGPYRVIKQLGEGGFGVVYLAEQERPRRTVALKVVRWTMASMDMLKRFEHETHILGQLQHTGIAQIFDAGVAEVFFDQALAATPPANMPFYTMEYIQGPNLLTYANSPGNDRPPHDVAGRLELIARVCDALQHAHQNGIIHRDLKPDNILVVDSSVPTSITSRSGTRQFGAQPKLLDFGIARALEGHGRPSLTQTSVGQLVGTPAYMSPEQITGDSLRVDTRSDVYAAGVLLYQLLTNRLPYDFGTGRMSDIVRVIEQSEPAPLRSAISHRSSRINPDVEAIVFKALAKDPNRRYQTAAAFASDIRRFLADEPIEAKRDSAMYLLRKNMKRYRGALSAAAVVVVLLIGFAIWSAAQARFNRKLADESIQARNFAEATAKRLATEVSLSNIDRGRAQAVAGNFVEAEKLIWHEFLAAPSSTSAQWALREFYARYANTATMRTDITIIRTVALSPDERVVAISGDSKNIEIWDIARRERIHLLSGSQGSVSEVCFSPDGATLASACVDGKIMLWNWQLGKPILTMVGDQIRPGTICFSPDGRLLFSGGTEQIIRVWDIASGRCRAMITTHGDGIARIRLSPDGHTLAAGLANGDIQLWNLDTLAQSIALSTDSAPTTISQTTAEISILKGHRDRVNSLAFSNDNRTLASVGWVRDRTIRIWNLETRTCEAILKQSSGLTDTLIFSPDSRSLYTSGWFSLDVWDVATRQRTSTLYKGKCNSAAISKNGSTLIIGSDRDARVLSVAQNPGVFSLGPGSGRAVAYHPNGNILAAAQEDGTVTLRDAGTGEVHTQLRPENPAPISDDLVYRVRALAFNSKGDKLVSASHNQSFYRWDLLSGKCESVINKIDYVTQQSIAFSPDGNLWAYATTTPQFALGRAGSDTPITTIKSGGTEALSACYSPDSTILATTGREDAVRLWTASGQPIARLNCPATIPWGLAFSPDGSKVLAGTWMFTIEVWDVKTHVHLQSLAGHSATVWGVQFKPNDNDVLASCSSDGTVRLWSLSANRNLATFELCPGAETIAFSISADGRRIAGACSNNEVTILDLKKLDECIEGNRIAQLAGDAAAR